MANAHLFGINPPATQVDHVAGSIEIKDGFVNVPFAGIFHPSITQVNCPSCSIKIDRYYSNENLTLDQVQKLVDLPVGFTKDLNCFIQSKNNLYKISNNESRIFNAKQNIWYIGSGLHFNDLQEANDSDSVLEGDKLYFAEDLTSTYNLTKRLYLYGFNRQNLTAITGSITSTESIIIINMNVDIGVINTAKLFIAHDCLVDLEANSLNALRLYAYNTQIIKAPDGTNASSYAFDLLNINEIRLFNSSSITMNGSAYLFGYIEFKHC